jgi:hypothetical protein
MLPGVKYYRVSCAQGPEALAWHSLALAWAVPGMALPSLLIKPSCYLPINLMTLPQHCKVLYSTCNCVTEKNHVTQHHRC